MPVYATLAGSQILLDIPESVRSSIARLLDPFILSDNTHPDSRFTVGLRDRPIDLDGTVFRGDVRFRECGRECFSLLDRRFVLSVSLKTREAFLEIHRNAGPEALALVFNALKWFMTYLVILDDGVPLHSSLLVNYDRGTLFCGPSGSGKTTISGLLASAWKGCRRGSDECNVVTQKGGSVSVFPTPFVSSAGKGQFSEKAVLDAMFFLSHAFTRHTLERCAVKKSFFHLLRNTYLIPGNRILTERLLESISRLSSRIPCFTLGFRKDKSVASFLGQRREDSYVSAL